MPDVASIDTYQACWAAPMHRVAEDDELVEADVTTIGGRLPVYPSGGVNQLRGEAVSRVDDARIGLAHNIGSPTAMSALAILEGSANGAG